MRIPRWGVALPILLACWACSNKLGGDLTVNGEAFKPSSCRSGAVYGFSGVEITGGSGWKLRLVQTPTGEANVVVFGPGSPKGAELGPCGTVKVATQNSTINDVKNVKGEAQLACSADGVSLSGKVTFANCH